MENLADTVRDSAFLQRVKGTGFRFYRRETVDKRLNHSEPQVPPQSKGTAVPMSEVSCEVPRSLSVHRKQPAQSWKGVSNRRMTSFAASTVSLSHCGPLERTPVSAASHTPAFVPVLFCSARFRRGLSQTQAQWLRALQSCAAQAVE